MINNTPLSGEQIKQRVRPTLNFGQKIWNEVYAVLSLGEDWYYPSIKIEPFFDSCCEDDGYMVSIEKMVRMYVPNEGQIRECAVPRSENGYLSVPPNAYVHARLDGYWNAPGYGVKVTAKGAKHDFDTAVFPMGSGKLGLEIHNRMPYSIGLSKDVLVQFYKKQH